MGQEVGVLTVRVPRMHVSTMYVWPHANTPAHMHTQCYTRVSHACTVHHVHSDRLATDIYGSGGLYGREVKL